MSNVGIGSVSPRDAKWDVEAPSPDDETTPLSVKIIEDERREAHSGNGLDNLMKPYAHINETKDILHKLGTVTIIRKQMVFSDPIFEKRFVDTLEGKMRSRMLIFGIINIIYSIYNMFFVCD